MVKRFMLKQTRDAKSVTAPCGRDFPRRGQPSTRAVRVAYYG